MNLPLHVNEIFVQGRDQAGTVPLVGVLALLDLGIDVVHLDTFLRQGATVTGIGQLRFQASLYGFPAGDHPRDTFDVWPDIHPGAVRFVDPGGDLFELLVDFLALPEEDLLRVLDAVTIQHVGEPGKAGV